MFQLIGSLIDNFIMIVGGIFLMTQIKRINKPFIKWIAIGLILIGTVLMVIDFIDKPDNISSNKAYEMNLIALNDSAGQLIQRFELEEALILLDSANKLDPDFPNAYQNKIGIYKRQKDYKNMLIANKKLIELKPDFAEAVFYCGMIYEWMDSLKQAKKYYEKSINLYDERLKIDTDKNLVYLNRLNRAFALIFVDKEIEARKEFKELKNENPDMFLIDSFINKDKKQILKQLVE